jgi:hypothetical protein
VRDYPEYLKIDILHITSEKEDTPFDPFISAYLLGDTLEEVYLYHEGKD